MAGLSCKNLLLRYGEQRVLAGVSFSFPANGIVAILGKSGCGKSSLLHILESIEKPDGGQVYYQGKSIYRQADAYRRELRRKEFGIVFQHYGLLEDFDGVYNVALPLLLLGYSKKKAYAEAQKLFDAFSMSGLAKKNVKTLSGGEKQRVALLRCFIKQPSVIFADEPTGALDEKNGRLVLKMLSSYAQRSLVILVTHNQRLLEGFAHKVIHLAGGRISAVEEKAARLPAVMESKPASSYARSYLGPLLRRNLHDDRSRNLFCFASGVLGFCCFLLSSGYLASNKRAAEEEMRHSLEYGYAYLSRSETVALGKSPLRLSKTYRPRLLECKEALKEVSSYSIHDDLTYFLPSSSPASIGGKAIDCSVLPFFDLPQDGKRLKGDVRAGGELDYCYVNSAFLSAAPSIEIGEIIDVASEIDVAHFGVCDQLRLRYSLEIVGIYDEFSFLNTPKVYYPFFGLEKELGAIHLENIGLQYGESISALDYLNLIGDDDPASKFDRVIRFATPIDAEKSFAALQGNPTYSLSNFPHTAKTSFLSLSQAFSLCLTYLFGVAALCLFLLLGLNGYAGFMKRKKEVAVIFSLGGKNADMLWLFCLESLLICLGSAAASLCLSPLLARLASGWMARRFGIENLFALPLKELWGVPFLLVLLLLLFAIIAALLPSVTSIYALRKFSLAKELAEE